jgi:geranylgeranyl reductase family protein
MKTVSDAIVVGGGPAGSFAALNLARHGFDVTVFEEHAEIGVPSHCAGHVSIKGLSSLGLQRLPSGIVENTFHGATFHSPKGEILSLRFSSPITCAIDRALFDKHLAEKAKDAGVQYHLNSRVESLIIEHGFVKGVTIWHDGNLEKSHAKLVIDAEGISSRLLRQIGLPVADRCQFVNAVEAEAESIEDTRIDMVEVFLGNHFTPGFFAWLIPKPDGKAKVGLAARTGNPKELLRALMFEHPIASKKLHAGRILRTAFHPISLGGPIPKAHANGFLAVGDAASHVKPTTGGGLVLGLTLANIAAMVAWEAFRADDFSAKFLSVYEKRREKVLRFDMRVMLRMRRMLDSISDSQIDEIIRFCAKFSLNTVLQSFGDIDFQGRSLVRALRDPRMLVCLSYFFYIYLSANP